METRVGGGRRAEERVVVVSGGAGTESMCGLPSWVFDVGVRGVGVIVSSSINVAPLSIAVVEDEEGKVKLMGRREG